MTKRIGKTFGSELELAGVAGLPFSWGEDGKFSFDPSMTQQQISSVLSVYEAHDADTSDALLLCRNTAKGILTDTDWTQIPGSELVNVSDFTEYRSAVRVLARSPVVNPDWPVQPQEIWSE